MDDETDYVMIILPKAYGLTGGIASGKSVVADLFREFDVPVIEADVVSHELCEPEKEGAVAIKEAFGLDFLDEQGAVNRQKMGKLVFSDPVQRKKLEAIMHPLIIKSIQRKIRGYFDQGKPLVLVEAALLMESGNDKIFHGTIVVSCSQAQQLARLMARDGFSKKEAMRRIQSQWSIEKKIEKATFVIDNVGSIENLRQKVKSVYEKIKAKKEQNPPVWN